jgi:hypothetical protein
LAGVMRSRAGSPGKAGPSFAFALTTIYGQMISVYQYPKPALLILGGSTFGAIVIGYLYGRNKRVWCRFLCPVNGVFGLLAKLAPVHFRVDQDAWTLSRQSGNAGVRAVNCAPLVAIKTMRSGADCHMCGRCDGFRDAISLAPRSPNHEIVQVAGAAAKPWESLLIVFGLMGIASGAFHWSVSPWFVALKQALAGWLVDHHVLWPLKLQPPWWVLTDYPSANDQMTLLDGACFWHISWRPRSRSAHRSHYACGSPPAALAPRRARDFTISRKASFPSRPAGFFLGLSAMTVTMLRAEGFALLSARCGLCCSAARPSGRLFLPGRSRACHRELSASCRGNRLCRCCSLDRRGELGCVLLDLAVTEPHINLISAIG